MFLTAAEVEQLTGRKRPTHQVRVLRQQGIPFMLRPKGSSMWPVVLRVAVQGDLPDSRREPEPQLKLPSR